MLEETLKFHQRTKIEKVSEEDEGEVPVTHVHVFHKEYPRFPHIDLPKTDDPDSQLDMLLNIRESTRIFSNTPIELKDVARILKSCRITDTNREPERRSYPSGGARFPVEIYLVSYNVDGLDSGAYHYNIKKEFLEQLLKEDLKTKRREMISPYLENPAATIVFASVISRSEVKYGYKAYPFSYIEAGHMGQNIHLACAEIGIGSCSVSGYVDDTIAEILDLTNDEIPIYTISIGGRR